MLRLIALLFFATLVLYATPNKVEIYAGSLETQGNKADLRGDIVVVYGDYILTAKHASYDKESGILELFDNVKVLERNKLKILGDYAKIDIHNKKRDFKPFYMLDTPSKVWLSADTGCDQQQEIDISGGVLSGCDPKDPFWQIEFSSSDYDKESKWLNMYNTVLYIYDIPVLYTPYFGYSLDTTRRTGLLTPSFGYSADEGVFFEQPFYVAEQNWWDFEFKPQIRTTRGSGVYTTFRFVDTKYSHGEINTGYFKEKSSYFKQNNLQNKKHYGTDFRYDNSNVLKSFFGIDTLAQSVIYVDAIYMNDIDYVNLATNDTTKNATPSQTISRINAFYNTDKNYIATYFKYYDDLAKQNNDKTLQQLPTLHYHRYLDTLLSDHLLYNFNVKSTYLHRKEGARAVQTNFSVPIKLRTDLLDEYLNVGLQTYIYGQHSYFQNDQNATVAFHNGYYVKNSNLVSVSTQLTKAYANFTHSISFSSYYVHGGGEIRNGFYEENKDIDCKDPANDEVCLFYKLTDVQDAIVLNFTQYFYDKSGKEFLYHRLSDITTDPFKSTRSVGELESELDWHITDSLEFYNNFLFNTKEKKFSKQLNKLSYHGYGFTVALSHFYKKDLNKENALPTSYYTSSLTYKYNSHYSYMASYDYDLEEKLKKRAEIGFLYQKRCWDFGLRYTENNRPILTDGNIPASIYDRYIYFTVMLKPIMKPTASDFFGLRLPKVLRN